MEKLKEIRMCSSCGLFRYAIHDCIQGRGNSFNPKVIMIGEAPGPEEDKKGEVFIGRAGKKLEEMIEPYHQYIYLTNTVKCLPSASITALSNDRYVTSGFRTPISAEIECCKPILMKELCTIGKGKSILMPLGNVALSTLDPTNKGISKEIGKPRKVSITNIPTEDILEFTIIPNYHPSYICRNPSMENVFKTVLKGVFDA